MKTPLGSTAFTEVRRGGKIKRARLPLDPGVAHRTNEAFYAAHPEAVAADGKRVPLAKALEADGPDRQEWLDRYETEGGVVEEVPDHGQDTTAKTSQDAVLEEEGLAEDVDDAPQTDPIKQCKAPPENTDEITPCCVKGLTVKCGHADRSFHLRIPDESTKRNGRYVLQVVTQDAKGSIKTTLSGSKKRGGLEIEGKVSVASEHFETAEITLDGGPCARGKPSASGSDALLPARTPNRDGYAPTALLHGGTVGINAPAPYHAPLHGRKVIEPSFETFFQEILIPDVTGFTSYQGSVASCRSDQDFSYTIEVFPETKWDGKVSFKIKVDKATEKKPAKVGVVLAGGITVKRGPYTVEYSAEYSNPFPGFSNFLEKLLTKGESLFFSNLVKIEILFPQIEFGGGVQLKEAPDDYFVGTEGKIALKLAPLIGISAKTDLLEWACRAGGPVGLVVSRVRDRVKKGVGNSVLGVKGKLELILTITGQIEAEFGWKKEFIEEWEPDGRLEGSISFSLEAIAEIEIKIFFFSVEAEGSAKLEAKVRAVMEAVKVGKDPALDRYIEFTGLFLSFGGEFELGMSKRDRRPDGGEESVSLEAEAKVESEKMELIGAVRWPDAPGEPSSLKNGADGGA